MIRAVAGAVAVVFLAGCWAGPDGERTGRPAGQVAPDTPAPAATSADSPGADEPSAPECDAPCYATIESAGTLGEDIVAEVSGMAASARTPGVYYVVSDEPGTSQVPAVREDGTLVALVEVEGMDAQNAEALSVGPCGSDRRGSCLYVADIGDHVGRDDVVVYRVPEPDLTGAPELMVTADELRFTYPGEPTDAEAVLVDDAGRPLIISKASFDSDTGKTGPTALYRGRGGGGVLEHLGDIDLPAPRDGLLAAFVGNVVTGASAADDRVLLRTYDEVLEYRADEADAELAGFPDWPVRRVPSPSQIQSETVTYRADGCGYLTTSEMSGSIDAVLCREVR